MPAAAFRLIQPQAESMAASDDTGLELQGSTLPASAQDGCRLPAL
jgi:hypothetical protein